MAANILRQWVLFAPSLSLWDRLQVNPFVAILAQRQAVAYLKSQFWKLCIGFQVVRLKVAALLVATVLAGVAIALKDRCTPLAILGTAADFAVALALAVGICIMRLAAWSAFSGNSADPLPGFWRVVLSKAPTGSPLLGEAHCATRCLAVGATQEGGDAAAKGGIRIRRCAAGTTDRRKSITPASVHRKAGAHYPMLLIVAPLLARCYAGLILLKRYADTLRRDLLCAGFAAHLTCGLSIQR